MSPNAATTNSDCGSPLSFQRWSFPVCWQPVQVLPPCSSSDRTGQGGFQISTFLLVSTPKLFFTTSRPHAGKRCHGNKAITQRQPQTGRPSKVACTHTQTHTKLQFTTTTAVTQRHSVPPMKGRLCGLFLEGLKGCCSGAMEEVVAHRQALLAASHTLLYPPQAPSLHLTCNMKCFYLPLSLMKHHVNLSLHLLTQF